MSDQPVDPTTSSRRIILSQSYNPFTQFALTPTVTREILQQNAQRNKQPSIVRQPINAFFRDEAPSPNDHFDVSDSPSFDDFGRSINLSVGHEGTDGQTIDESNYRPRLSSPVFDNAFTDGGDETHAALNENQDCPPPVRAVLIHQSVDDSSTTVTEESVNKPPSQSASPSIPQTAHPSGGVSEVDDAQAAQSADISSDQLGNSLVEQSATDASVVSASQMDDRLIASDPPHPVDESTHLESELVDQPASQSNGQSDQQSPNPFSSHPPSEIPPESRPPDSQHDFESSQVPQLPRYYQSLRGVEPPFTLPIGQRFSQPFVPVDDEEMECFADTDQVGRIVCKIEPNCEIDLSCSQPAIQSVRPVNRIADISTDRSRATGIADEDSPVLSSIARSMPALSRADSDSFEMTTKRELIQPVLNPFQHNPGEALHISRPSLREPLGGPDEVRQPVWMPFVQHAMDGHLPLDHPALHPIRNFIDTHLAGSAWNQLLLYLYADPVAMEFRLRDLNLHTTSNSTPRSHLESNLVFFKCNLVIKRSELLKWTLYEQSDGIENTLSGAERMMVLYVCDYAWPLIHRLVHYWLLSCIGIDWANVTPSIEGDAPLEFKESMARYGPKINCHPLFLHLASGHVRLVLRLDEPLTNVHQLNSLNLTHQMNIAGPILISGRCVGASTIRKIGVEAASRSGSHLHYHWQDQSGSPTLETNFQVLVVLPVCDDSAPACGDEWYLTVCDELAGRVSIGERFRAWMARIPVSNGIRVRAGLSGEDLLEELNQTFHDYDACERAPVFRVDWLQCVDRPQLHKDEIASNRVPNLSQFRGLLNRMQQSLVADARIKYTEICSNRAIRLHTRSSEELRGAADCYDSMATPHGYLGFHLETALLTRSIVDGFMRSTVDSTQHQLLKLQLLLSLASVIEPAPEVNLANDDEVDDLHPLQWNLNLIQFHPNVETHSLIQRATRLHPNAVSLPSPNTIVTNFIPSRSFLLHLRNPDTLESKKQADALAGLITGQESKKRKSSTRASLSAPAIVPSHRMIWASYSYELLPLKKALSQFSQMPVLHTEQAKVARSFDLVSVGYDAWIGSEPADDWLSKQFATIATLDPVEEQECSASMPGEAAYDFHHLQELADVFDDESKTQAWLQLARLMRPRLNKQAQKCLIAYQLLTEGSANDSVYRTIAASKRTNTVYRLAFAHARLHLRENVNETDCAIAIGLVEQNHCTIAFNVSQLEIAARDKVQVNVNSVNKGLAMKLLPRSDGQFSFWSSDENQTRAQRTDVELMQPMISHWKQLVDALQPILAKHRTHGVMR